MGGLLAVQQLSFLKIITSRWLSADALCYSPAFVLQFDDIRF